MTDDMKKNQGQQPGQSGQQSGQPQQTKPQDPSKKDPSQNKGGQDDKHKQHDQGGQRRAS